jgi:hypothetical protein
MAFGSVHYAFKRRRLGINDLCHNSYNELDHALQQAVTILKAVNDFRRLTADAQNGFKTAITVRLGFSRTT